MLTGIAKLSPRQKIHKSCLIAKDIEKKCSTFIVFLIFIFPTRKWLPQTISFLDVFFWISGSASIEMNKKSIEWQSRISLKSFLTQLRLDPEMGDDKFGPLGPIQVCLELLIKQVEPST